MKKKFLVIALLSVFLAASMPVISYGYSGMYVGEYAGEKEPSSSGIMFDILVLRPLGLAAMAAGTAVFIAGLPFTIPARSVRVSADRLVKDPFKFTFVRPVGEERYYCSSNGDY